MATFASLSAQAWYARSSDKLTVQIHARTPRPRTHKLVAMETPSKAEEYFDGDVRIVSLAFQERAKDGPATPAEEVECHAKCELMGPARFVVLLLEESTILKV